MKAGGEFDPVDVTRNLKIYPTDTVDARMDLGDGPKRLYSQLFRIAVTTDRRRTPGRATFSLLRGSWRGGLVNPSRRSGATQPRSDHSAWSESSDQNTRGTTTTFSFGAMSSTVQICAVLMAKMMRSTAQICALRTVQICAVQMGSTAQICTVATVQICAVHIRKSN